MVEKSHTAGWWPQLHQPLRNIGEKIADWFAPRADAAATQEHYEVNMELPGVAAEDIEVSMHDDTLMIKGEKRFQREETGRSYYFSEREYGAFQRSFRLPADADAEKVSADFKNGVLTVTVPKAGARSEKARRVEIRSS